ncbi:MAG: hypothetical protein C5B49_08815 [Bdellovibrio sp.]|nr:MAG: hypothetical protein C5B49_08815 [Bdellovibrio sp.]
MTGSLDQGFREYGPKWRTLSFIGLPQGEDKILVFIEGATHVSFSDYEAANQLTNGLNSKHQLPFVPDLTVKCVISFFDKFLKGRSSSYPSDDRLRVFVKSSLSSVESKILALFEPVSLCADVHRKPADMDVFH